jgi:hypothetical protein
MLPAFVSQASAFETRTSSVFLRKDTCICTQVFSTSFRSFQGSNWVSISSARAEMRKLETAVRMYVLLRETSPLQQLQVRGKGRSVQMVA